MKRHADIFALAGWVALVDMLLLVLSVLINQVHPQSVSDGLKINAEYVITAEWSVDVDADVDLWVGVPPDGEPVFYTNRQASNTTLDQDNKGFSDSITKLSDGTQVKALTSKEMTTIRGNVPGRFDVEVFMFNFHRNNSIVSVHDDDLNTKVRIEVTKLNPTTKMLFAKDVFLTHVKQGINVVSFDLDQSGNLTFADPPLDLVSNRYYKGAKAQ